MEECGLFTVNLTSVPYSKDYNFVSFHVEDDSVVSNPESIITKLRIRESFGMLVRVFRIPQEGLANALLHMVIKFLNILDGPLCINQPIIQRPKTSLWVFLRPLV